MENSSLHFFANSEPNCSNQREVNPEPVAPPNEWNIRNPYWELLHRSTVRIGVMSQTIQLPCGVGHFASSLIESIPHAFLINLQSLNNRYCIMYIETKRKI